MTPPAPMFWPPRLTLYASLIVMLNWLYEPASGGPPAGSVATSLPLSRSNWLSEKLAVVLEMPVPLAIVPSKET
jgi:hypothetical protein